MIPSLLDEAMLFETFDGARDWAGQNCKGWPAWRVDDVVVTVASLRETVEYRAYVVCLNPSASPKSYAGK